MAPFPAPALHVVLVEPEIPFNTGNAGRTCVAAGAALHLVGRLGFSLSERHLKRGGMDYWPKLDLRLHESWDAFRAGLPAGARLRAFSPAGKKSLWEARFSEGDYLIFGKESVGLSSPILAQLEPDVYRIPMRPEARSLNLSSSVAIAVYEARRQVGGPS